MVSARIVLTALAVIGASNFGLTLRASSAETAEITGFRSAMFAMTEAQVRAAIERDFKPAGKIVEHKNETTRTPILSVRIQDLIPERGVAQIDYVFGYKSKRLIQVNVVWSVAIDPKITSEMLRAVIGNLAQTLRDKGFPKDKVVVNAATRAPNVVLVFRGQDSKGRVVALVANFKYDPKAEPSKRVHYNEPQAAILSYIANPKSPDVFRLPPGKF